MNRVQMKTSQRLGAVLVIALLFLAGCTDAALTTTSKALADTAVAVSTIQSAVIAANQQNLLSVATTQEILILCNKVNVAGAQASQIVRAQTKLTVAQRGNLTAIIKPVLDAVNQDLATGLLGIPDGNVKTTIQAALTTIQAALVAANVALGGQ